MRRPSALAVARRSLEGELRYHAWLQWLADEQWQCARTASPVKLFGDLPFMVGADSADVWAHQSPSRATLSVGTPPDAFSDDGPGLGPARLPLGRRACATTSRGCARARRRGSELFDGYRVDHVDRLLPHVGARTRTGSAHFTPEDPTKHDQRDSAGRSCSVFQRLGRGHHCRGSRHRARFPARVAARARRARLQGVPLGARLGGAAAQPFLDPAGYAALSVATTGTHDTETLAEWWDQAPADERDDGAARCPACAEAGFTPDQPFDASLRDALPRR